MVLGILVPARRVQDAPPESRPKLDLVGTLLSATGSAWRSRRAAVQRVGMGAAQAGWTRGAGVSPVVWLVLGGLFVVWLFLGWERRLEAKGAEPLVRPSC